MFKTILKAASSPLAQIAARAPRSVHVGDHLVSLQQGVHKSLDSGSYLGHGEYKIRMDDGGNGPDFTMHFQLIAQGGGRFVLRRIDAGDPFTHLTDHGNGVLKGGAYTLNFR